MEEEVKEEDVPRLHELEYDSEYQDYIMTMGEELGLSEREIKKALKKGKTEKLRPVLSADSGYMTVKEVADSLGVSEKTIKNTLKNRGVEINFHPLQTAGGVQNVPVLTQEQATAVKIDLQNRSKVAKNGFDTLSISNDCEMILLQKKLSEYQDRRIKELEAEVAKNHQEIFIQKKAIEYQAPMVDGYKKLTGSSDTIDIGQVAKILAIKGLGRNKLFEILRDNGILNESNQPYQKYVDAGYFRIIESRYMTPDGETHIGLKTVVFQKGVEYIRRLVEGKYGA